MILLTIITIPNATSSLASIGEWSSPFFTSFLPIVLMFVGVLLGGFAVGFAVNFVKGLFGYSEVEDNWKNRFKF